LEDASGGWNQVMKNDLDEGGILDQALGAKR
jgi:ABC-type sulfate transport system substrate-binding protein